MMTKLFTLVAVSLTVAACSSSDPQAIKANDQVAVQSTAPLSDADSDKYIQGMIDSDETAAVDAQEN